MLTAEPNRTWPLPGLYPGQTVQIVGAGWPLHTLWCVVPIHGPAPRTTGFLAAPYHGAYVSPSESRVLLPSAAGYDKVYPLRPIPLNFAPQTALYALPWFFLALLPGPVRRHVRRRRGRCPHSGYDRRTLPAGAVCPECGGR